MHREHIITTLNDYANSWARGLYPHASFDLREEEEILTSFINFSSRYERCFERDNAPGHFTGSTLITSPDFSRVLLTLHSKLNFWLQLGGHADGDPLLDEVALREAREESGLSEFTFLKYYTDADFAGRSARPLPFDIDCHLIPQRKDEPAHYHYDVRYVLIADPNQTLLISDESHELKWFTIGDARNVTSERSMHRQFDKLEYLAARQVSKFTMAATPSPQPQPNG